LDPKWQTRETRGFQCIQRGGALDVVPVAVLVAVPIGEVAGDHCARILQGFCFVKSAAPSAQCSRRPSPRMAFSKRSSAFSPGFSN
jgi:hypothetical protein